MSEIDICSDFLVLEKRWDGVLQKCDHRILMHANTGFKVIAIARALILETRWSTEICRRECSQINGSSPEEMTKNE